LEKKKMSSCTHDLAERETACADGMCPICTAADNERLKNGAIFKEQAAELTRLRAENAALRHVINMAARTLAGEGIEDQGEAYDKCARMLDAALGGEKKDEA
jgi:hypothetical protein